MIAALIIVALVLSTLQLDLITALLTFKSQILLDHPRYSSTMKEKRFEWGKVSPYLVYHMEEIHLPKYFGIKRTELMDGERLTCRITRMEEKAEIPLHFWHLHLTIKLLTDV